MKTDRLLIYTDIIEAGISYTRQNMDDILVYNGEKNDLTPPERKVQPSKSRDLIAKTFLEKGGDNYIKFGPENQKIGEVLGRVSLL